MNDAVVKNWPPNDWPPNDWAQVDWVLPGTMPGTGQPLQLAQLKISPGMGGSGNKKTEKKKDGEKKDDAKKDASPAMKISPGMGSSKKATPEKTVEKTPSATKETGGSKLNITISNPENLPKLPSGTTELQLVIKSENKTPPAATSDSGIGFLEILTAFVIALVLAPYLQREAGKWMKFVNAFDFVRKNGAVISIYLLTFSAGWIIFMIVLPQLFMLDFSFRNNLPPADVGGLNDVYTKPQHKASFLA